MDWLVGALRASPRVGSVVDLSKLDQGRGAEYVPALHQEARRVDERTTGWTAARDLATTARNRIPLRNRNSSGWIRTTDLTIMSRALSPLSYGAG